MGLVDVILGKDEAKAAVEMASACVSHLSELVKTWQGASPTADAVEDVTDALDGICEGLDLLTEGDIEQGSEQIEAVAGALDPTLLDDDKGAGDEPAADAEPKAG